MKAKITIEIEFTLFPEHYPEGTSPEIMLRDEVKNATEYPDEFIANNLGHGNFIVKGVLI